MEVRMKVRDLCLCCFAGVVILWGQQSPGDIIGHTAYDLQSSGSFGQRLMVDGYSQAHIVWMYQDYPGQSQRYIAWNARFSNGTYYGETQITPSWSGYAQVDITRDSILDDQRSVVTYHYDAGSGYTCWIDIDQGNLWGAWPNNPSSILVPDRLWGRICVAYNNNILMTTGDYNANEHHLFLTADEGSNWTPVMSFDSAATLSHHVRASHTGTSNKVVFAHTKFINDSIACGQLDNDVCYIESTDGGITWSAYTNITQYQPYPLDSVRACCGVNAVYDHNDNLHIAWQGRYIDSTAYYQKSKVFHWDEVHDTITVINSPSRYYNEPGGWWLEGSIGSFGAWRLPADEPQLVVDHATGWLYCLWHGNDDTTDVSAGGFFNGELYASYSTDGGLTWADYVNLTNTRTPGGNPGYCHDEDYMTACPYERNDSLWLTYIEDKDAGSYPGGEGTITENPVRCWVLSKTLEGGIARQEDLQVSRNDRGASMFSGPLILPEGKTCRVFDITGRQIHTLDPAPGIYFIQIDGEIRQKIIKIR